MEAKIARRKVRSKVKFVFPGKIETDAQKRKLGVKDGRVGVRSGGREMQLL